MPNPTRRRKKGGLAALHFLSVAYAKPAAEPFPANATNTLNVQVILTRGPTWEAGQDPLYWLVFEPNGGKYTLAYSTATSWDAADPDLGPKGPKAKDGTQPYFVPTACQMCHGGDPKFAVLHSFDTDWCLDKVQPGEDFDNVFPNATWGPLYDCGKDPIAGAFKDEFAVFRKLNAEIEKQNQAVLKTTATAPKGVAKQVARQAAATAKWLDLHRISDQHVPPLGRAHGDPKLVNVWKDTDPIDKELLPLLNRYCYRCHSSLRFNVFDKEALVQKPAPGRKPIVSRMIEKLEEEELVDRMPQDRDMKGRHNADWKKLIDLLKRLENKFK